MHKQRSRFAIAAVVFFAFLTLAACGGGGSSSPGNSNSGSTTNEKGQFLLVADAHCSTDNTKCTNATSGNGIAVYRIGTTAGSLSAITGSPFFTGAFPTSAAVNPNGTLVIVANAQQLNGSGTNSLSAFTIASNGTLSQVSGSPFASTVVPRAIAFDPQLRFLYSVGDTGIQVYRVATDGSLTATGSVVAVNSASIVADTSGKLVFITGTDGLQVYSVAADGTLTPLSGSPIAITGARDVSLLPGTNFGYVTFKNNTQSGIHSFTYDVNAGTVTDGTDYLVGTRGFAGLVFQKNGGLGYSVTTDSNEVIAFKADLATGALTQTASVALPQGKGTSVTLDTTGSVLFTTGTGINVMAVDAAGGISNPQNAHDCQCVMVTGYRSAAVVNTAN